MIVNNDHLSYTMRIEFPHLKQGVNYWIGQAVCNETLLQVENAKILAWEADDLIQPTEDELQVLADKNRYDFSIINSRKIRDTLLSELDPILMNFIRFSEYSSIQQEEIKNYRQLLLDIPEQRDFPNNIKWPKKPSFL